MFEKLTQSVNDLKETKFSLENRKDNSEEYMNIT